MSNAKRDNAYWRKRLRKDGHEKLLAQIEDGEMTVYRATVRAGYRKRPSDLGDRLSHHWRRADHSERKRFVLSNLKDVNRVLREVGEDLKKAKAKQDGAEPGNSPTS